jgi:hypothetical protein
LRSCCRVKLSGENVKPSTTSKNARPTLGGLNSTVAWRLGSTPFRSSTATTSPQYRAKLAWYIALSYYTVDPSGTEQSRHDRAGNTPRHQRRQNLRTATWAPPAMAGIRWTRPTRRGPYNYRHCDRRQNRHRHHSPSTSDHFAEITSVRDFDSSSGYRVLADGPFIVSRGEINDSENPRINNTTDVRLMVNPT